MPPARILHVITDLEVGGAEIVLCRLLEAGFGGAMEVRVITLGPPAALTGRIEGAGIPVHSLGIRGSWPTPRAVARLRTTVRAFSPDLIQGWMYHGNLAALAARRLSGARPPVVWSVRQSLHDLTMEKRTTALLIRLGARFSGRADFILYNADRAARQHEALGYDATRRAVIPNGFDTRTFRPSVTARRKLRARLGIAEDACVVGLIARFHPVKDHAGFLKAARIVSDRRPEAAFVLVGQGVDGDNQALRRCVRRLDLAGSVHLLGEVERVADLTAGLDIVCSASRSEAFPNAIGEAMACGVPCVVTDVGDSARLVGDTGLVVPPSEPVALARACLTLIGLGPEGRRAMGLEARRRVAGEFSLSEMARRYRDLYARLLGED